MEQPDVNIVDVNAGSKYERWTEAPDDLQWSFVNSPSPDSALGARRL